MAGLRALNLRKDRISVGFSAVLAMTDHFKARIRIGATALLALFFLAASPAINGDLVFEKLESSPRIDRLLRDLAGGKRAALDDFWSRVQREGAPIVEDIEGDPAHKIVTFVWRAESPAKTVMLGAQLTTARGGTPMVRVLDTDLWFITYRLRSDLRFVYGFLVDSADGAMGIGRLKPDPLNRHTPDAKADTTRSAAGVLAAQSGSELELPNASTQPYILSDAGVAKGAVEEKQIDGAVLETKRRIWVYTPVGYETDRAVGYSVLICFDGGAYRSSLIATPTILDNLIAAQKIPPLVAIFIDNPAASRQEEQANNPKFADFVAKEVMPWVHNNWRVTSDPRKTILCGFSSGGLSSMFVAYLYPNIFGSVLSQSGAYWRGFNGDEENFEWLTHEVVKRERLPLRIYLEWGAMETSPAPNNGPSLRDSNRHLRDALVAKRYGMKSYEAPGGHDYLSWRATLSDGLMYLLKP
jgi:enterochelin esterase family protein